MAGNSNSGRKAKPAALKILEGKRDHRPIQPEPQPSGQPKKPRGMDTIASRHWDDVVKELMHMGVATSADQQSLEAMCLWWSAFKMHMSEEDTRLAAQAFNSWRSLAQNFGMTPAERSKLAGLGNSKPLESKAARFLA